MSRTTTLTPGRYGLASDFGLDRDILKKKLLLENAVDPVAKVRIGTLLGRSRDRYARDEVVVLLDAVLSPVDRAILASPDEFNHQQVLIAQSNEALHGAIMKAIKKPNRPITPKIKANIGRPTLEQINTSRFRVVAGSTEIGFVWKTIVRVPGEEKLAHGWTHSRSTELFRGRGGGQAVLADLMRMARENKSTRTSPPAWAIRQ